MKVKNYVALWQCRFLRQQNVIADNFWDHSSILYRSFDYASELCLHSLQDFVVRTIRNCCGWLRFLFFRDSVNDSPWTVTEWTVCTRECHSLWLTSIRVSLQKVENAKDKQNRRMFNDFLPSAARFLDIFRIATKLQVFLLRSMRSASVFRVWFYARVFGELVFKF